MPEKDQQQVYPFTLILGGFNELTQEIEDALYEAGCDDALLGIHCGTPYLDFDREAKSLKEAVLSAIEDVLRAGKGITVLKVQPPGMDIIEILNEMLKLRQDSRTNRSFFDDAWQIVIKD